MAHPRPRCRQSIRRPHRTSHRIIRSRSAKRNSRTSAWRRSMSSTRRTPESCSSANSSLGEAVAAAAAAAAAAADAPSSGPAAAVAAAEGAAAVGRGDVAASARRARVPTAATDEGRHGRALADPAISVFICSRFVCGADQVEARRNIASLRLSGQRHRQAPERDRDDGALTTRRIPALQW